MNTARSLVRRVIRPTVARGGLMPTAQHTPTIYALTNYHQTGVRNFRSSPPQKNFVVISLGVGVAAMTAKYGLEAYTAYKNRPTETATESDNAEEASASSSSGGWFDFSKRFYDGPFEDKMTRREAALILGVRESASADRIKAAHRRILVLNHPDTGGSTFLATKINEAKEMLLKGK